MIVFFSSQNEHLSADMTCRADHLGNSELESVADEWTGDFFPGIPSIKYEVRVKVTKELGYWF